MRTWEDEKSAIYLLLLLVRHGQNNFFFGRTELEKIRYHGSLINYSESSSNARPKLIKFSVLKGPVLNFDFH